MARVAADTTVSVAMCTYNGEQYVEAQLSSITNQTQPPHEVVIGDDGSTDRTLDIVERFIAAYRGPVTFRLAFRDRVGGVSPNFARTLAECTGQLIALSDQDDVWHPDRLELAASAFAAHPGLVLVNANARLVDGQGTPLGATLFDTLQVAASDFAAFHLQDGFPLLLARNTVTGATTMLRRELLDVALPIPAHWVHDEWLAILAAATRGHDVVERPLIDYRIHGGNEIGVSQPTLKHKASRVLSPRGARLTELAARAASLVERLATTEADAEVRALAKRKAAFESRRAAYPGARWRRIGPVLRNARGRDYAELSSQGRTDVLRDLLQPR